MTANDAIETLKSFTIAAEKSRKYPRNTAAAMRSVLNLIRQEINDEERSSVEKLQQNLSAIFSEVYNKFQDRYSADTLDVYKKRISRLLRDYLAYGKDPQKMVSWVPHMRMEKARRNERVSYKELPEREDSTTGLNKLDFNISPNRRVIFQAPNLTKQEAEKLKGKMTAVIDLWTEEENSPQRYKDPFESFLHSTKKPENAGP